MEQEVARHMYRESQVAGRAEREREREKRQRERERAPSRVIPPVIGYLSRSILAFLAEERMRRKLILFGDSITEESFGDGGWGAALAHLFSRTADVVLRGYSGYNTRWALKVVERALDGLGKDDGDGRSAAGVAGNGGGTQQLQAPLATTVFFGANDASLPDRSSAFQHVPLPEYRLNLHAILSLLKKRWPSTVVVLITPPPIDEDGRLRHPYGENPTGLPERTNEAAGAYAKACVSVAMEAGVPVVDLWSKMQQFPGWEKALLRDGLHLTPDGNKVVFEEVAESLKQQGLSPDTLPADLPLLSEIDPLDPLKSFDYRDGMHIDHPLG